jgi:hypothetical protein
MLRQLPCQISHFNCGYGYFNAFVAVLATGAVNGLLLGVGGKQAEDKRALALYG